MTHSSKHATWMCIYSATFFFPVLPFQLDLFLSCAQPQTFRQIPKETNDHYGRKHVFLKYIIVFYHNIRVSYMHTHSTCCYINLFLFVLLSFECSFVRAVYIVCFSIMSQYELWEQNIHQTYPTLTHELFSKGINFAGLSEINS